MADSLTNNSVASTYKGILHAEGAELPQTGLKQIRDGNGNTTSMLIGRAGQGVSCQSLSASNFIADNIQYPSGPRQKYNVVIQSTSTVDGTATLGLSSIPDILKGSNVGLTYNSYEDLVNTQLIPYVKYVNGLATETASKNIVELTKSVGGISKTVTPSSDSTTYVKDLNISNGIVTKVHYGNLQETPSVTRNQVRTFFLDLRLDPDDPINKTTKAGRYYDESSVTAYVQSVWNLSHETFPIAGDIAVVVAMKTANAFKAVAANDEVVSITVTETGMKAWGYRWSGSEWVVIGSREIEPGDDPTSWLESSAPSSGDENWPLS